MGDRNRLSDKRSGLPPTRCARVSIVPGMTGWQPPRWPWQVALEAGQCATPSLGWVG